MAIEQTISLSAVGADATASEIAKTSGALNGVVNVSRGMEDQFSHRFTHIGLQVFAGDLLRTSGLGAETRQIVGVLQTSMIGLSSAFGAAGGPILLVGSALTALVGIILKVSNSHKEMIAALNATHEAQQKSLAATDSSIESLNEYIKAGGEVTPVIREWLKAENDVRDAQMARQEATDKQIISTLQATIAQEKLNIAVTESIKPEDLKYLENVKAGTKQAADTMDMLAKSVGTQTLAMNTNIAKLKQLEFEYHNLKNGVTDDMKALAKASKDAADMTVQFQTAAAERSAQVWEGEQSREKAAMDNRLQYWIQTKQAEIKASEEQSKKEMEFSKKMTDQIAGDLGQALAKSIVEGKDFTEQMQQAFQNMAEQVIEDIIKIETEIMVLRALGYEGPVYGSPGGGSSGGGGGFFGGMFATGGSAVVSSPTLFIAGEGGPEIAQFTPVGSSNPHGGGGGGSTNIGEVHLHLSVQSIDGNNPSATLDQLADQIRRETASARRFASTIAGVAARYPNSAY